MLKISKRKDLYSFISKQTSGVPIFGEVGSNLPQKYKTKHPYYLIGFYFLVDDFIL